MQIHNLEAFFAVRKLDNSTILTTLRIILLTFEFILDSIPNISAIGRRLETVSTSFRGFRRTILLANWTKISITYLARKTEK